MDKLSQAVKDFLGKLSVYGADLRKKDLRSVVKTRGKMSDSGPPARPMKYPYTFSAKVAQFPLKYYFTNQWIWKYYFISLGVCLPVFYSISKLANSPANKAKWAEMRRKEAEEHHH